MQLVLPCRFVDFCPANHIINEIKNALIVVEMKPVLRARSLCKQISE